jgi:hypothetical protein
MKNLILALSCIAAITTFASCTADNVNDSKQKSNDQYFRTIDSTGGDGAKDTSHG